MKYYECGILHITELYYEYSLRRRSSDELWD